MLLKTSFSYTKKFFRRTLQSFKSLLSGGYQRLPKTPPFNPFSCGRSRGRGGCCASNANANANADVHPSYGELDKLYTKFANEWGYGGGSGSGSNNNYKARRRSKKKIAAAFPAKRAQDDEEIYHGSFMKFATKSKMAVINNNEEKERRSEDGDGNGSTVEEERSYLVAEKLRELGMMDVGNVDHVLDIEEVLHYYSRLTCPAYLHMVDMFFMNMCSEFFSPSASGHNHVAVDFCPSP